MSTVIGLSLLNLLLGIFSSGLNAAAFRYYCFDPFTVYCREDVQLTLEVATTGADVTGVTITYPSEIIMHDDGTHGDRLAGDGIYTRNDIPNKDNLRALDYGGTHCSYGLYEVRIDKTDATSESQWLSVGLVAQGQDFPAVQLAEGIYATDYAVFIEDPSGEILNTPDWPLGSFDCTVTFYKAYQKLYSVLPDVFDFGIVMPAQPIFDPARDYAENSPFFRFAHNDVQNIGISPIDINAELGSAGRLKGMIYHSWGDGQILDHEFGHMWCAHFGNALGISDNDFHWNELTDIGGQMCNYLEHPDLEFGGHLKDNGDGTWRIERDPGDNELYSKLDLYLMGFISKDEVPPVHMLVDPDMTDRLHVTSEQVITYTIDELIAAEGGDRIPSDEEAQTEFNVVFIVVKNKAFTQAEFAFYSLVSRYFASEEQGDKEMTTFYTATGGQARLNALLPVSTGIGIRENRTEDFRLVQNFPNPFNPCTEIRYELPRSANTEIAVFNLQGHCVKTLGNAWQPAGAYAVLWDGTDEHGRSVPGGVYVCRIRSRQMQQSLKMILMK
ncbi:hypothetical protein JW948_04480 [bacterium]|nr:hypothetical protein [bacterium]